MLTFNGYVRPDGRVGVRNNVICIPTVNCANAAVEGIAREVQGVVPMIHTDGCDTKRVKTIYFSPTIINMCKNPNNYAVIIVGLGCERDNAKEIGKELSKAGIPVYSTIIQEDGGCNKVIRDGAEVARRFLKEATEQKRETVSIEKLVLAVETPIRMVMEDACTACAGNKTAEAMALNAATFMANWVVEQGGTAILPSVYFGKDAIHDIGKQIKTISYSETIGETRGFTVINPYNEKWQGEKEGLFAMDPPEAFTGMFASGAQIGFYASGKCVPLGFPSTPIIKYCTDANYLGACEDMDLSGDFSPEFKERCISIFFDVINGKETISEQNNESDDLMCIYRRTNWY